MAKKSTSDPNQSNKAQCLGLVSFECSKLVKDSESKGDSKRDITNNAVSEWNENYCFRFTLSESLEAHDVILDVPVFINETQQHHICLSNISRGGPLDFKRGLKWKYMKEQDCIRWMISQMKAQCTISQNLCFKLNVSQQDIELEDAHNHDSQGDDATDKQHVLVFGEAELNAIQIPNHSLSGIVIASIRQIQIAENEEMIKFDVWTRYNT